MAQQGDFDFEQFAENSKRISTRTASLPTILENIIQNCINSVGQNHASSTSLELNELLI